MPRARPPGPNRSGQLIVYQAPGRAATRQPPAGGGLRSLQHLRQSTDPAGCRKRSSGPLSSESPSSPTRIGSKSCFQEDPFLGKEALSRTRQLAMSAAAGRRTRARSAPGRTAGVPAGRSGPLRGAHARGTMSLAPLRAQPLRSSPAGPSPRRRVTTSRSLETASRRPRGRRRGRSYSCGSRRCRWCHGRGTSRGSCARACAPESATPPLGRGCSARARRLPHAEEEAEACIRSRGSPKAPSRR